MTHVVSCTLILPVPTALKSFTDTTDIPVETCSAVKTGIYKTLRSYLCALPQARINQCDVSVTPSHHNMLDVGGGPKRCTRNAVAAHKHEKPFEVDRKAEERRQMLWYSGVAHLERRTEGGEHSVLTQAHAAHCEEERWVGVHVWEGGRGSTVDGRLRL